MVRISDVQQQGTSGRGSAFVEDDDASSGFVTEEEGSDALSDAGSDLSDSDDKELERALRLYNPADETLGDRLYALRDMVSPATRQKIAATWNTTTSWTFRGGKLAGNAVWVVTTSALLVVLPLALSIENESMLIQQEGELLAQQQGQQQMLGGGQPGQPQSDGVRPAGF